jgi:predicted flap endonuclease-1-like 5' DNA nuclease
MNIMQILVSGLFSAADSYGKGTATAEIIIMLLVAFILGYLLKKYLSRGTNNEGNIWEDKYKKLERQYVLLEEKYNECCNKKQQTSSALRVVDDSTATKQIVKENLQKIEGIGPKIEQLLYAEGIYTWDALANTTVEKIKIILQNAGPRYKMHNPQTWPEQAKMAANGQWEELKKWQDKLKGGRKV